MSTGSGTAPDTEPGAAPVTGRGPVPGPLRDYLDRLDTAARALTRADRQDLRARVWLDVAAAAGPTPSDDELGRVLEHLGPPEELVPGGAAAVSRLRDPVVVHLLGCSLLTAGVTGVLGLVRVWRAPSWPARDALLATVLVVAGAVLLPSLTPVQPVAGAVLGGLGVGAPVAGLVLAVVLAIQRRRHRVREEEAGTDTPRGGG